MSGGAVTASQSTTSSRRLTVLCWTLAAGVFAMFTSEAMAGGLLPVITADLRITVTAGSALIWAFAVGQMLGAWAIGMPLASVPPRAALTLLLVAFVGVQVVGLAVPFVIAVPLRAAAGALMTAYMSIALSLGVRLTPAGHEGRTAAIVFAGGTIGATAGVPLATYLGNVMGWRGAFLADAAAALLAAAALFVVTPRLPPVPRQPLAALLRPLRNGRLWLTFATSALTIGAALVGFAFFSTILKEEIGLSPIAISIVLGLYGAASLVGNLVVGKVAHTGATRVVAVGLIVLIAALVGFALSPTNVAVAVPAIVLVGLTGVALNPAQTVRNIAAGGSGPAVMAMAPTVATAGIFIATLTGGLAVGAAGLIAPLWIGTLMALFAMVTLLPHPR